jgi:hypothetical protein
MERGGSWGSAKVRLERMWKVVGEKRGYCEPAGGAEAE